VAINIVKQIPPAVLRACLFISLFRAIVDLDNDRILMASRRCTNPSNDRFGNRTYEIHLRYTPANEYLVINVLIKENRTDVRCRPRKSCITIVDTNRIINLIGEKPIRFEATYFWRYFKSLLYLKNISTFNLNEDWYERIRVKCTSTCHFSFPREDAGMKITICSILLIIGA